ncbi:uncharacterized protein K452DRAFT_34684 [Aplosporella prunicola CBS 121167]|uniref:Uncharacterized protein n=1 Tax=Aplosporella prunicola CBS 121167 TaxID=1176127 RepID=A0A6A6BCB6_9PEZI|nr:uncharacterized protein K452DRAFT_34684 [Aplosporella prunicola CBS 121167]KAF2141859.1 hypothetical protein K452DRAFT_34684 [Aplosporella prunicola CBS 121167]
MPCPCHQPGRRRCARCQTLHGVGCAPGQEVPAPVPAYPAMFPEEELVLRESAAGGSSRPGRHVAVAVAVAVSRTRAKSSEDVDVAENSSTTTTTTTNAPTIYTPSSSSAAAAAPSSSGYATCAGSNSSNSGKSPRGGAAPPPAVAPHAVAQRTTTTSPAPATMTAFETALAARDAPSSPSPHHSSHLRAGPCPWSPELRYNAARGREACARVGAWYADEGR